MNIKDFIYSKKDEGIYRIRTVLGIKIISKPINNQIESINSRLNTIYDIFIRGGYIRYY